MPPAKSKKAAKSGTKAKGKATRAKGAARPAPQSAKASKSVKAAKATTAAAPTRGGNVHAHCAASDPFGDPCQNLPRRPSRYCVIHSDLER